LRSDLLPGWRLVAGEIFGKFAGLRRLGAVWPVLPRCGKRGGTACELPFRGRGGPLCRVLACCRDSDWVGWLSGDSRGAGGPRMGDGQVAGPLVRKRDRRCQARRVAWVVAARPRRYIAIKPVISGFVPADYEYYGPVHRAR
jgi:hypothetical protein